ncbi:unnamed protein product [Tilletia laevis]|uniref:Glutaryl-CoA dehydrogenase n=2 Tax=Tilletia TaxID=13289 RepID=A0A177V9M3_9BASI|nr:hypothetical protein CF336_g1898 [Tilletia laevis]KAE8262285.1 hypothetical protein A4X03_0g2574 [Tilletia caries]KAE8199906.1 hypothetical protein CF335_g4060 [Tilletia laevis]CAD6891763.1 unnamed protein product [Tilletia caries]CAD6900504.1 unnamed protein product [Tilletia caries]
MFRSALSSAASAASRGASAPAATRSLLARSALPLASSSSVGASAAPLSTSATAPIAASAVSAASPISEPPTQSTFSPDAIYTHEYKMTKFSKFDWEDPFEIKSLLTEDEIAIQETARAFAQDVLAPKVKEMYRNESWDPTIMPALGEVGLLGVTIDGYGCAGVSNVAYGLVAREIERVDSGFRSIMSVQSSLAMGAINQFGSEAQKEKYLPRMAKGELVGCFGLTEPNHGSDPSSMETVAKDTGDGEWILNGSKTWISSSPYSDVFVIWARCPADNKVRGFVLDKDTPGLSAPPIKHKMMLRASVTGSIFLDNVRVKSSEALLPHTKPGLGGPFECLNSARYGISWGSLGALEACISEARQYALDRHQFKKPLAGFQLIQKTIVDAHSAVAFGLLGSLQVGRLKDQKVWCPEMVSMVKRNNCGAAVTHARLLLEIFGGNAASDEYATSRHAANLHVVNTYEGTSNIHGLIIGKAITGVQAFA